MKIAIRLLFVVLALAASVTAQETVVSGLLTPSKLIFTPRGHLLVAEAGNGANTGRVSIVDRITHERRTLISGLPSSFGIVDGVPSASGPSGVAVQGNTLYVVIGEADSVLPGPVAGSQAPNPAPQSAFRSAILSFTFPFAVDDRFTPVDLSASDRAALQNGPATVGGTNGVSARIVANLDDFRSEPRTDFQGNVRASNPYGIAILGGSLFINDAGWNSVRRVNPDTGAVTTLTEFNQVANPTGIGGRFTDAVPDSIRADGERLLVTLLTGFPFAPNISSAIAVDPNTGSKTPVVTGLTSAIDVVPVGLGDALGYVVSQFSTNLRNGAPGKITLHHAGDAPVTLLEPVVSPSSIAVDQRTGDIFITQIFLGTLARINAIEELPSWDPSSVIPIAGSVAGAFGSRFETSLQISNGALFPVTGAIVLHTADARTSIPYTLAALETKSYANLFAAAGVSGLATMDIDAAVGPVPRVLVRIYDTSRGTATTGTIIEQVAPRDALMTGDRGVMIAALDPSKSRANIGVRALATGARLRLTLLRSNGTSAGDLVVTYAPNEYVLQSLSGLFGITQLSPDMSVAITVLSGAAIPHMSIVNNTTQETSWHRAVRIE